MSRTFGRVVSFLRSNVHYHALAFQLRQLLHFPVVLQVVGETGEQQLSLFLEQDGTSLEEYVRFHLVAFFQELLGMLQFEVVVMLVGLRSEPYLLDDYLRRLGFLLLLTLLLVIQELLIVNYLAYGRYRSGGNFYQVQVLPVGNAHRLCERIDALLHIVAYQADFSYSFYRVVDAIR